MDLNRTSKIRLFGGVLVVLLILLGISWHFLPVVPSNQKQTPMINSFNLENLQGRHTSSQDLLGKPLFVHFWASWCPPCVEEFPAVLSLAQSMKDSELKFVLISTDPAWEEAKKLLPKEMAGNVLVLLDPKAKTSEAFGTYQFPETYIVKRTGEIAAKLVGPQNWHSQEIQKALREL